MKNCSLTVFLKYIIQGLIFLGCLTFVTFRGYECFVKYLDKPQSNRISYRFNSKVPFPTITFCPTEESSLKNGELQNCQLTKDDYLKHGQWVGKSDNPNCTNPKILINHLMPNIRDLNIEWILFKTFEQDLFLNSTMALNTLQWNPINFGSMICFELTLPYEIREKGQRDSSYGVSWLLNLTTPLRIVW